MYGLSINEELLVNAEVCRTLTAGLTVILLHLGVWTGKPMKRFVSGADINR